MEDKSDSIKVYTGTEVSVALLKAELEKAGVVPMIEDDFSKDITGFFGSTANMADLYVRDEDMKVAKPIIEGFMKLNPS